MDPRDQTVECPEHGTGQATFVCSHVAASLRTGVPVGFFTSASDNPRPDAWCSACEERLQRADGEWTEETEAFAGVTLICGGCYDRARELNTGR